MYAFDYHPPASTSAAAAAWRASAQALAGGQSLIQAMKLRLSSSRHLVDLGGVADLKGHQGRRRQVVIGAMTTTPRSPRRPRCARRSPRSPNWRAASATRWCATWARSAARSPMPTRRLLSGCGARPGVDRPHEPAHDRRGDAFFTGLFETALQPGELITAVSFAAPAKAAYAKFASRRRASRWSAFSSASRRAGCVVAVTGAKANVFRAKGHRGRAREASFPPAAARRSSSMPRG